MNLLIIENNSFLKDNFFFQDDLKKNFNLFFSSSIVNLKKIIKSKKLDFIIVSAFKSNSFDVINDIFKKKPKIKIIQILEKKNDYKHDFSSYFIKKPISINKLLLLLANFKKKNVITKKIFDLKNGLVFKKIQRKLLSKIKKKEINLTEKECDILNYLIKEKKLIKKSRFIKKYMGI